MTEPGQALARARDAAATRHEAGGYVRTEPQAPLDALPVGNLTKTKLSEWALIEPALDRVYSTRRYGAPITFVKRGLIRFLHQYFGEAMAQESRFNALAAVHIFNLEERVRWLELALDRERARR